MILNLQELEEVNAWIDEKLYLVGVEAGNYFVNAYPGDTGMSQVRNLQNIAFQSSRFSTIENFVKNQIGKEKEGKGWLFCFSSPLSLGEKVLQDFQMISQKAKDMTTTNYAKKMEIQLRLVRAYVDALAAQFAYRKIRK